MLLKLGSSGPDVVKLQQKLGLKDDGSFGTVTESKIKSFQSSNGLLSDGIVNDATWDKIFGVMSMPSSPFELGKLNGHLPDSVLSQISETALKFNITNILRLSHFLAQCSHESGGFKLVQENLNYSAKGLTGTFPKYFDAATSLKYERKPDLIASRVYANRMGNGDETSKEGYKFRGRGYIQLTGKQNYIEFGKFIGEDLVSNPDAVASKYPLASAAFFFNSNGLWSICDKGATDDVVTAVTKRVNGGTIGLDERIKNFKEYYKLLTS